MSEEYCNLENEECKKANKVATDSDGYICCTCGKRVSKWLLIGHPDCRNHFSFGLLQFEGDGNKEQENADC